MSEETKGCWNFLFTRSVIAKGFQIPPREAGKGLEISFPTMAALATIQRLVEYDKGLIGEGLNTFLIPIEVLDNDQAMQWHIEEKLVQVRGEYQSRSGSSILKRLNSWYRELRPAGLASRRAFLGWTPKAKVIIGTVDGPKKVTDSGSSLAQQGRLHITSYNATISSGGLSFGGPGFGVAAAPSRVQSYCANNNPTILGYKLRTAAKGQAILYDTGEKIAWQVPQSCLMLQMMHTAIRHWNLKVDGTMKYANDEENGGSSEGDGLAAFNAMNASRDLKFSMGAHDKDTGNDMLERLCLTLARATDFQAEQNSDPERGDKKAPKWILGVELIDAIEERSSWRIKESKVEQPWAHLADDTCPIFFCRNLGQAIAPTESGGLCRSFQQVPSGNDYFVTSGLAVCDMLARHEYNDGARLSGKVRWRPLQPMIQLHGRRGNRICTHTHHLLCEKTFSLRRFPKITRSKAQRYKKGAFIFHGSPGVICVEPTLAVDSLSVSPSQTYE